MNFCFSERVCLDTLVELDLNYEFLFDSFDYSLRNGKFHVFVVLMLKSFCFVNNSSVFD